MAGNLRGVLLATILCIRTGSATNYYKGLATLIKGKQTVGVEFDQVSLQMMDKLKAALPDCEFVDIGEGAMKLRMIKSTEEIEHISKMTKIADLGGEACVEAIGVGVAEHEVALHSTQAMVKEIARVFPDAELLDTWTWFQIWYQYRTAHIIRLHRVKLKRAIF